MIIKDYNLFKEGLLSNLSTKIGQIFSSSNKFPELGKYNISAKKISDKYYQFLHNKRVIAELKVEPDKSGMLFKLTIYYYDSEIKNHDGLKLNQKIGAEKYWINQDEQPYAKGSKRFFHTEKATEFLIRFWKNNTKSGSDRNPDHKINL
jgi:hypothetical protein